MPQLRPRLALPGREAAAAQFPCACPADFAGALLEARVELRAGMLEQLRTYIQLLTAAGELMNLTAIREPEAIWMKLVLDALMLVPTLGDLPDGSRGVDVGCGGGIPGLPLAIALPGLRFTLVDATEKKIEFVKHAIAELGLGNAEAVVGRAETLASARPRGPAREGYDFVVARALAPLPVLLELTAPFARAPAAASAAEPGPGATESSGGRLVLVKGERATEELGESENALQRLKVRHVTTHQTPTGQILVFEKRAPTPQKYPRGNGVPKRSPL